MFRVYNSSNHGVFKPANNKHYPSLTSDVWINSDYPTLQEAREYCNQWLGVYAVSIDLIPGVPYDFNGYGDYVLILELKGGK